MIALKAMLTLVFTLEGFFSASIMVSTAVPSASLQILHVLVVKVSTVQIPFITTA